MRMFGSVRWGWRAALGAGVVWLLVWAHQSRAHGMTQVNERNVVLGLTWMDAAKFLVVPFALLLVAVATLRTRRGDPGRLGRIGFALTYGAVALLIVGVALEFWAFPWGSYERDFGGALPKYGGLVQTLASLAFTAGALLLAIDLNRHRILPLGIGLALVSGAATTIYLTPVLPIPGLAWLALGAGLWWTSRTPPEPPPGSNTPVSSADARR